MDHHQKLISQFQNQSHKITPQTQIHISNLIDQQFKYSIVQYSNIHKKQNKKNYKIQLKPNLNYFKQIILQFIQKFHIKKITLNLDEEFLDKQNSWQILKDVEFQQIKFHHKKRKNQKEIDLSNNYLQTVDYFQMITNFFKLGMSSKFFEINLKISCSQIYQIFQFIQSIQKIKNTIFTLFQTNKIMENEDKSLKKIDQATFRYRIHLETLQIEEIIKFIEQWCIRCGIQCQQLQSQQEKQIIQNMPHLKNILHCEKLKIIEKSPFKINENILEKLKNQYISIYFQKYLIVSLNQIQKYGFCINLGQQFTQKQNFVNNVIDVVLNSKFFISLEIQELHSSIILVLSKVIKHYSHHSNYLIKIGNQIQITSYRLLLNTKSLKRQEVSQILNLMYNPGHYEFIFYGTVQHFSQIRQLFIQKPFIKFNYFIPIEQIAEQISQMIQKMQCFAQEFKQKVFQFTSIIKDFSYIQLNLVEALFLNLHRINLHDNN